MFSLQYLTSFTLLSIYLGFTLSLPISSRDTIADSLESFVSSSSGGGGDIDKRESLASHNVKETLFGRDIGNIQTNEGSVSLQEWSKPKPSLEQLGDWKRKGSIDGNFQDGENGDDDVFLRRRDDIDLSGLVLPVAPKKQVDIVSDFASGDDSGNIDRRDESDGLDLSDVAIPLENHIHQVNMQGFVSTKRSSDGDDFLRRRNDPQASLDGGYDSDTGGGGDVFTFKKRQEDLSDIDLSDLSFPLQNHIHQANLQQGFKGNSAGDEESF